MKLNFVRQCSMAVAAGLVFFLGCARPSAEPEQPKALAAPTAPPVLVAQAAPAGPEPAGVAPADSDPADTNAPAILDRIPASNKPENVPMSPGLAEVVKLAQAGVGEEVILAYIEKYPNRFGVGADQILYLNDLGVSGTVITSMLKHDGTDEQAIAQAAPAAPSVVQTQPVSNVPQTQVVEEPSPQVVSTAVAPPPTSTEVSYFYDTLSPYGSWVYLSGYGWCWQPTVAVSVPTWRPYCDRGRWYWSDTGWYWSSDYSWGWAAFHYGRWYRHPGCGWVWTPGLTWAPSWVSWRYSDGYCGWAPLPPAAHFVSGVGFSYYGRHVSVGFDFGLRDYHYSFVHVNNFCDYAPYRYVVPHAQVRNFYRNTTVVNNYIVRNNNTVINHGIGRETIARTGQNRIREISVKETPVRNMTSVRGDRIQKEGSQTVVYRPQLPKTPPQVRTAQFAARSGAQGQAAATVARNSAGASQPNVVGRTQTGAAARQGDNNAGASQAGRSQGNTAAGRVTPDNRNGREAVGARGNGTVGREQNVPAGREQNAPRNTQPNANPGPSRQSNPAPSRQPRANNSLFGPSTGSTAPQQNNAAARTAEPQNNAAVGTRVTPLNNSAVGSRVMPQQNNVGAGTRAVPQPQATAPVTRAVPQPQHNAAVSRAVPQTRQNHVAGAIPQARGYSPPSAAAPQPQVQAAPRNSGRGVSDHQTISPRQYEQQTPRYTAPASPAPQYSRPAGGGYATPRATPDSSGSVSSSGGRAGSGGGGGGGGRAASSAPSRAERNR